MDEYSDDSRYTITFEKGGYVHVVKGDGWITMDLTAAAISARAGRTKIVNNFNGAEAVYCNGVKVWSDNGVSNSTA